MIRLQLTSLGVCVCYLQVDFFISEKSHENQFYRTRFCILLSTKPIFILSFDNGETEQEKNETNQNFFNSIAAAAAARIKVASVTPTLALCIVGNLLQVSTHGFAILANEVALLCHRPYTNFFDVFELLLWDCGFFGNRRSFTLVFF